VEHQEVQDVLRGGNNLEKFRVEGYYDKRLNKWGLVSTNNLDVLRIKSEKVPNDPALRAEVEDLLVGFLEGEVAEYSLGLAMIQMGYALRVFGARLMIDTEEEGVVVFFNPEIEFLGEEVSSQEGCLSIEEGRRSYRVKRNNEVLLRWEDKDGTPKEGTFFDYGGQLPAMRKSWEPYIIQHERDHLDGELILDEEKHMVEIRRAKNAPGRNDPCPICGKKAKGCEHRAEWGY